MSDVLTDYQREAIDRILRGENVCCVGPGGSGKSEIIKHINIDKSRILMIAPSGMAALNMDEEHGRTIHSIFKIAEKSLLCWDWQKVKKDILKKKEEIKELFDAVDHIIIDEWSMINSGLFDTLVNTYDFVCNIRSGIPLEGKPVICLGDPLQLPPIPGDDPMENNCYSRELDECDYLVNNRSFKQLYSKNKNNIIHFNINQRCTDSIFNNILHHTRTGFKEADENTKKEVINQLNQHRFTGNSIQEEGHLHGLYEKSLKTTLKRATVETINDKKIGELIENGNHHRVYSRNVLFSKSDFHNKYCSSCNDPNQMYDHCITYMDNLDGYICEFSAVEGERVMLRVNNVHDKLRNGSLGTIVQINDNSIDVEFDNESVGTIEIKKNKWTHPIFSDIKVEAFPLIPAWAITIHKLQGQTIDSPLFIICHAESHMDKEHLMYTAISRLTQLDNLYIIRNTPIIEGNFPISDDMYEWYKDNCL